MSEADCSGTDPSHHTRILKSELKRRRMGAEQLSRYLRDHHDTDCDSAAIEALLQGRSTSLNAKMVERILEILRALPPPPRVASKGSRLGWIEITDEMRAELNAELSRTNASIPLIVRRCPEEVRSLTANKISCWRTGRTKQANPHEWSYFLNLLKSLPDRAR